MRYETYETRARFSYRAVLITLTSHLVVIDFRQGRLSTAETGQRVHRPRVERHSEDWFPKTRFGEVKERIPTSTTKRCHEHALCANCVQHSSRRYGPIGQNHRLTVGQPLTFIW